MTIDEKRKGLVWFCDKQTDCEGCPLYVPELKCGRGEHFLVDEGRMSDEDVNRAYSIAFYHACPVDDIGDKENVPHIKDSGTRRQFDTGAVRDIQEGKGRCDLLPLDVVAKFYGGSESMIFNHLNVFMEHDDIRSLPNALYHFMDLKHWGVADMFLEVAKHFEEGAKKYGEHNWQKGIPTHCYIDSAVRHYLKWLRGDKDEPHDRAFCWNILCCIWTCTHKPELNDYAKPVIEENQICEKK